MVAVAGLALGTSVALGSGVIKVMPEFLDLKGRNALSPSLYERDAYQLTLREHPERRSGIRFYVQWKAPKAAWEPLLVRVELRGDRRGPTAPPNPSGAAASQSRRPFQPLGGTDDKRGGLQNFRNRHSLAGDFVGRPDPPGPGAIFPLVRQ